MDYVTSTNGRVGHIVSSVSVGTAGRVVGFVCGQTFPESQLSVNNNLDVCTPCLNKANGIVEAEPTLVKASESKAETQEKTKTSEKQTNQS